MVNFPTSLDALSNPGATTKRDATGFEHHLQHANANDILEALETKLGIGATTPDAIYKTLMATAAGTTSWDYHAPVKIATLAGTGASGVLTFSSIPAVFSELELLVVGRSDTVATSATVALTCESSPTAGAYDSQITGAANTTVSTAENIGATHSFFAGYMPAASSTANLLAAVKGWFPRYATNGKMKPVYLWGSGSYNLATTGVNSIMTTGVFEGTSPIDTLKLTLSAGNWTTDSYAILLGKPA